MSPLQRRVLLTLIDEGVVVDAAGRAIPVLAGLCDLPVARVHAIVCALVGRGWLERDHNPRTGRTFRVAPTAQGRGVLGRDGFVDRVVPRREAPPVLMPVLGPIGRLRFDPDACRAAAMEGV